MIGENALLNNTVRCGLAPWTLSPPHNSDLQRVIMVTGNILERLSWLHIAARDRLALWFGKDRKYLRQGTNFHTFKRCISLENI